jgi:BirA family biotin operon repressor/biotin-[acetyl-CoA-carboxylase] ligase
LQLTTLKTLFTGRHFIELPSVDSTNSHALRLLSEQPPPEGTAILAHFQSQGRGQREARWHSEHDMNLMVSVILYPSFLEAGSAFDLNVMISLAMHDYFSKELGSSMRIKWPNDIYLNECKLGGILIENTLRGRFIASSVVGFGINVNQTAFDAALPNPVSMKLHDGKTRNLDECLCGILNHMEARYIMLRSGHIHTFRKQYANCLLGLHETRTFKHGDEYFQGIIRGVGADGRLHIEHENGTLTDYDFKEIRYELKAEN